MVLTELSRRTDTYISEAMYEAHKSPCRAKHGCIAVLNGRIIGRGYNYYRNPSSDGFIHNICTCHAEMAALREIYRTINGRGHYGKNKNKIFKKTTLYVVRVNKENILQKSTPCTDCMEVIKTLQIKKIVHSDEGAVLDIMTPPNYKETHYTIARLQLMGIKSTPQL